ncbi:MAG: hypothetical protein P4L85_27905, partial [Paludisphaera borealis]
MRRTTSALTTTILGAVLSASTVSAQQSLPSASARRAGNAATAAAPGSNTAVDDPSFGMAAARGPRYLLRNGLDYIDYQEFDRALKYLREAEKRQAELGPAEKLKLKQAIERAQRGLRESIGSEAPYALSSRSRRPGGVVAAASDTRIAAAPARTTSTRLNRREGDDRGEPIRLAAVEVPAESEAAALAPAEPSPLPEIPQQPEMPRLDVVNDRAEPAIMRPADAPTAPVVSRISPGDARAIPASTSKPVADAVAAQADLTTPFPDLDAAGPASTPALKAPTAATAT